MEKDPNILKRYTKEELINYIIMSSMSAKFQEMLNCVKKGDYNTRYALAKIYGRGQTSHFIREGLHRGFLKRRWVQRGTQQKAILMPAIPIEKESSSELVNKATPEIDIPV